MQKETIAILISNIFNALKPPFFICLLAIKEEAKSITPKTAPLIHGLGVLNKKTSIYPIVRSCKTMRNDATPKNFGEKPHLCITRANRIKGKAIKERELRGIIMQKTLGSYWLNPQNKVAS
jgi:hypothetical protein